MTEETPRELLHAILEGYAIPDGLTNLAVDTIIYHFPQILLQPQTVWGVQPEDTREVQAYGSKSDAEEDLDRMQIEVDDDGNPYNDVLLVHSVWTGPWREPDRLIRVSKDHEHGIGENSSVIVESTDLYGEKIYTKDGRPCAPLKQWLEAGWTSEVLDGRLGA